MPARHLGLEHSMSKIPSLPPGSPLSSRGADGSRRCGRGAGGAHTEMGERGLLRGQEETSQGRWGFQEEWLSQQTSDGGLSRHKRGNPTALVSWLHRASVSLPLNTRTESTSKWGDVFHLLLENSRCSAGPGGQGITKLFHIYPNRFWDFQEASSKESQSSRQGDFSARSREKQKQDAEVTQAAQTCPLSSQPASPGVSPGGWDRARPPIRMLSLSRPLLGPQEKTLLLGGKICILVPTERPRPIGHAHQWEKRQWEFWPQL